MWGTAHCLKVFPWNKKKKETGPLILKNGSIMSAFVLGWCWFVALLMLLSDAFGVIGWRQSN